MVGLGARNTLGDAQDFVSTYGTTFPMRWDPTGASWKASGVSTQPAAVLIAADGTWLRRWSGEFPGSEVLRLVAQDRAAATVPSPG